MPILRTSAARFSPYLITAAFDTAYDDACGHLFTPALLTMLMMRPCRAATIDGRTADVTLNVPCRFVSMVSHHCDGSTSQANPLGPSTPALFTSTSIGGAPSSADGSLTSPTTTDAPRSVASAS